MIFFGRDLPNTGCEILVKVGSRYADPNNDGHFLSWRDGQVIGGIKPMGFRTGNMYGFCLLLIKLPNVNYLDLGGKTQDEWGTWGRSNTLYEDLNHQKNVAGKHKWEFTETEDNKFKSKRRHSDYFIDVAQLLRLGHITVADVERIYDYSQKIILTLSGVMSIDEILMHEERDTREDPSKLEQHASITSGTHSIGNELDYDTVEDFEAAIGSQLSGDLTGEVNDEEVPFGTDTTFDTDTNTNLLKLTAQSGDEHTGGAYGNGARINFDAFNDINFNETTNGDLDDIEVSNLAFDIQGAGNIALNLVDGSDSGSWLVNRCLMKGDSGTRIGIASRDATAQNINIRNNICYDITDGTFGDGIAFFMFSGAAFTIYNNTCIACRRGINNEANSTLTALVVQNNLTQANTTDMEGSGWPSNTAKNITEDDSGPDAAYDDTDVNTNSVFLNYGSDDFRINVAGDSTNLAIVDDGEDLSGTFTDDVQGAGRRAAPFDIGASQRTPAATGLTVGTLTLMGVGK